MTVLEGIRVVDLGVGMGAALAAKFLVELGADVVRLEPAKGDPFYDVYEAYSAWQASKWIERVNSLDDDFLADLLAGADICIIGGEDFPGLNWRPSEELLAQYPKLISVDLAGYATPADVGRPAVDLLVQARTGIVYEHYADRPIIWALPAPSYGIAMQAIIGILAALYEREDSGRGQVVATSLQQGAITWFGTAWCEAERPDQKVLAEVPKSPRPTIFRCRDGEYIHLVLGTAGGLGKLNNILGLDSASIPADARGLPTGEGKPDNFFGDIDLWASLIKEWDSADLLKALWQEGMAAEQIMPPGQCWDDPQVDHNGILIRHADGMRSVGLPLQMAWQSQREGRASSREARNGGMADAEGPLTGVRIVDLGNFIAGPFGGTVLSDLGAEVIKIEPNQGDPMRVLFRAYLHSNRGKRVISVDLKREEGLKLVQQACIAADVVLSNFRPGVSKRLGVDPDTLHDLNPELIVEETSGYGPDGPRSGNASFDMVFLAMCGHEHRAGGEGNPPLWYRTAIVDVCAGLFTAVASLTGLLEKKRHGRAGARLTVSMLDTGLFLMSELIQRPDGSFGGIVPLDSEQTGFHPAESLYQTADGWIAVAARSNDMAARFASLLGLDEVASLPRGLWGKEEKKKIASTTAKWRSSDLLRALEAEEIWSEECRSNGWARLLHDPQAKQIGLVVEGAHERYGWLKSVGPGIQFSRSCRPLAGRGGIADLGEHTRQILEEMGVGPDEIDRLYREQVIA